MDFGIKKGQLEVNFTQGEMDRLTNVSGDTLTSRGAVDEVIDTIRHSDGSCRLALHNRLPYEDLHAVW